MKAIAHEWCLNVYVMKLKRDTDTNALVKAFRCIASKSILLLEDIDCMTDVVHQRCEKNKHGVSKKGFSLSDLLNLLDGIVEGHGVLVIMTSNYPDKLDNALKRERRIDYHCRLGMCSTYMLESFFKLYFNAVPSRDILNELSKKSLTPAAVAVSLMNNRDNMQASVDDLLMRRDTDLKDAVQ